MTSTHFLHGQSLEQIVQFIIDDSSTAPPQNSVSKSELSYWHNMKQLAQFEEYYMNHYYPQRRLYYSQIPLLAKSRQALSLQEQNSWMLERMMDIDLDDYIRKYGFVQNLDYLKSLPPTANFSQNVESVESLLRALF